MPTGIQSNKRTRMSTKTCRQNFILIFVITIIIIIISSQ